MPTFLFNVYCFETACTYLIDLYEGILTRWQRGTANIGIKIPFCWPFAVPYWKTRNFYCFRQTKDQLNLKWKLSDNIIEYYGHLIVFFLYAVSIYCTRPTTHDTMQNCLKWEAYWTFSLLVALANNFLYDTHTHTHIYYDVIHAHTHTKSIQKLEWLADFFLSFFVFFVIFFPHPLLSNGEREKKMYHYHCKRTNSIEILDDFTVVVLLRFSSQFLLHLFIHLTKVVSYTSTQTRINMPIYIKLDLRTHDTT